MSFDGSVPVVVETPQARRARRRPDLRKSAPAHPRNAWFAFRSGEREVAGLVWPEAAGERGPATEIREITEICDALPPLPRAWCELAAFAAGYYQRGLGEIALSVLPAELRRLDNAAIANRLLRLERRLARAEAAEPAAAAAQPPLAPAQAEAGERIAEAMATAAPGTVLLHGVTGSGKTEVYLRAAAPGPGARPAGAGAGARDQPDAAAGGALRRALSPDARSSPCTAA